MFFLFCFFLSLIVRIIDSIINALDIILNQNPPSIFSDVIKLPIIKIELAIITINGIFFFIYLFSFECVPPMNGNGIV